MDKKNDIQVNKVNKWDYGVVDMSLWHLKDEFDALVDKLNGVYGIDVFEIEELTGDTYSSLDKVLERFNELEVVHQKECGMISQYEEENHSLRGYISRSDERRKKMVQEYTELEKEKIDLEGQLVRQKQETGAMISQYEEENRRLREQKRECDRHIDLLDKLRWALEDKGIYCEWSEAALKWNLYDTANICKSCKQHFEEELRIRCKEIDDKNKLIDELNQNIKDLKDTLEKDGEFGKNIGKCVADSIREGCDKGVYELHPYTRIDIHVEETNNMPTTFDRHAIPRIAVMFNNTQTEMERDTAQHECEELDKKVDRLWSVNEELNRKIKELKKENKDLKTTLAVCAVDANTAKKLCDGIVSKVKRTRNNKEE